jgi:site-specific DNA-methyltransferase (adenine-specific)
MTELRLGDCLDVMGSIPDGSIDLIACDLPFGTTACRWDQVIPFEPLWAHYRRLIKPRGAIVLNASQPFTSILVMSNPEWFRYEWIWDKVNHSSGYGNAKRMPLKRHESACVFYQKSPTYNPQMGAGKPFVASTRGVPKILGRTGLKSGPSINRGTRYPTSIIRFKADIKSEMGLHPTQKPVALMEYLIRTYSNEGDTVLDNAMGSGTTGIACLNTGRNFIGIESDPSYFAVAERRIAAELDKTALFA